MSRLFQRIRTPVSELQSAYKAQAAERVQACHAALVQLGHDLSSESALQFCRQGSAPTGDWSATGMEGALAYLRAVELANRFDPNYTLGVAQQRRRYLLLLAALDFYRCGRHGVAAAIQRRADAQLPEGPSDSPMLYASWALTALCRHGPAEKTWITAERSLQDVTVRVRAGQAGFGWLAVACVCQALLTLRDHLQSSRPRTLAGLRQLRRGLRLAHSTGDGELCRLLEAFYRAYQTMCRLSLWSLRQRLWPEQSLPQLAERWIRHRIAAGRAFLFPSQYRELVERGALHVAHALVSMPTGAGKSLLAELFSLRALLAQPKGKVLVIVPSRALAAEKGEELRNGLCWGGSPLRVCHMTGETALNSDQTFREHNIIVLTPEKFDTLMRSEFFGCSISGLVVDEFHVIRATYRGIKLQLSLARFVRHPPYDVVPTLYISAMLRPDDFMALRSWAFSESPLPSDWKPTPARIGTVALDVQPWCIEFNDGTWRDIISTSASKVRRNATTQASQQIVADLLRDDQVLHFNLYWHGFFPDDNVLIEMTKDYIVKNKIDIRKDTNKFHYVDVEKNKEIALRIERILGKNHDIARAFRCGIAVHWGELPHPLRRLMERAIRDKAVALILATTTLADGVNLPIKTVYVPKLATSRRELPLWQFLNLVGRAGRPFFHEEGQVVVASCEVGPEQRQTKRDTAKRYAEATTEQVEVLVSASVATAHQLGLARVDGRWPIGKLVVVSEEGTEAAGLEKDEDGKEVWSLPELLAEIENFSACLLATLVEGVADRLTGSTELERALFLGTEEPADRLAVHALVELVEKRLLHFAAVQRTEHGGLQITKWGRAIYRTGFGPESCDRLRIVLVHLIEDFETLAPSWARVAYDGTREYALFEEVFKLLALPLEAAKANPPPRRIEDRPTKKVQDIALLRGWLAGQPLDLISRRTRWERRELSNFEAYVRLDGALSTFAEWVLYAAWQIARERLPITSPLLAGLEQLAGSIRNGHYDPTFLQLLRRDIGHELLREDVLRLYRVTGRQGLARQLSRGVSKEEILALLLRQDLPTLLPEPEFAAIIERISASWHSSPGQ